jgi:hypothetical protein
MKRLQMASFCSDTNSIVAIQYLCRCMSMASAPIRAFVNHAFMRAVNEPLHFTRANKKENCSRNALNFYGISQRSPDSINWVIKITHPNRPPPQKPRPLQQRPLEPRRGPLQPLHRPHAEHVAQLLVLRHVYRQLTCSTNKLVTFNESTSECAAPSEG